MMWRTAGDEYVLEAPMDYHDMIYATTAVLVRPVISHENRTRIGWAVWTRSTEDARQWVQVTADPIPMLQDAKAVAEAWWRMR